MSIIRPQTLTRDGQTITLSGALGYSIADMRQLFDTLDDAEDTIEAEVSSKIAKAVATVDECTQKSIEEFVRRSMDLKRYGLEGQEFSLTSFAVVPTFRVITGELPSGNWGSALDTNLSSDEEWGS